MERIFTGVDKRGRNLMEGYRLQDGSIESSYLAVSQPRTIGILDWIIFVVEAVLCDVWQHHWPPLSRCQ